MALSVTASPAWAEPLRTLGWETLAQDPKPMADPLAGLDMWARDDLRFAAGVLAEVEAGRMSRDSAEYKAATAVLDAMRDNGLDVDRLIVALAEREAAITAQTTAVNSALDGEMVRLPGYALPLSVSTDGVMEFLLVPFVGACIHYPPPPPNQVIRVLAETPQRFADRYETVWLTGRLRAVTSSSDLDYVDGQARVPTAWTMEIVRVEPYATDPSAETTLGSFSPIALGPRISVSRRGGAHPSLLPKAE
ncbi:MAG: DUF3299 domain-containing protein [Pseudomonadota bacterium]